MNEIGKNNEVKKRIGWVDMAKGVAILSVIVGHTLCRENPVENMWLWVIYSFHMPLFFILSAFTFQFSTNTEEFNRKTSRAFKDFIVLTLCLFMIRSVWDMSRATDVSWQFWKDKALELLYASGVDLDITGITVPAIGMLWFLVVFFSARCLYDWMQFKIKSYKFYIGLATISCFGVLCGQYLQLPLSFDITLAVLPFFWCGRLWKSKLKIINRISVWVFMSVWILTLVLMYAVSESYPELARRVYPLFPLSFITAVAGVLSVSGLCRRIAEKHENLCKPLMFLGEKSILLFRIHYLDKIYETIWHVSENNFYNSVVRICVDVVFMIIIMKIYKYVLTFKNG